MVTLRLLLVTLVVVSAGLAGCLGGDDDPAPSGDAGGEGDPAVDSGANVTAELGVVFQVGTEDPRVGTEVGFDAAATRLPGGDDNGSEAESEATFEWDFGDGGSATGVNVSHTYEEAGFYIVTLIVRAGDDEGNATQELPVRPPPEADLDASWEGDFPVGAPMENGAWVAEHDLRLDDPQEEVAILLEGSGAGAAMSLYLLDESGEEVDSATGSGASKELPQAFLAAGSYTLRVHMTQGASGSYTLTATGTATIAVEAEEAPE